jgi:hypothetical protein
MNNYPPCPENITIKKNDLSTWQQEGYKESKVEKLCLTFYDKKNYVVNYRYLKLIIGLGVEVKINRVLEYNQTNFMEKFIMLNTVLRTEASKTGNKFGVEFFKLMSNSVFGKTMENVKKRINFRLISTPDEAYRAKNVKRYEIFNENLVGLHQSKTKVLLNKPIYLGQNILDDSKYIMYNFHYNFMLKHIPRDDID